MMQERPKYTAEQLRCLVDGFVTEEELAAGWPFVSTEPIITHSLDKEGKVVTTKTTALRVALDFSSHKPFKTRHYSSTYDLKTGKVT